MFQLLVALLHGGALPPLEPPLRCSVVELRYSPSHRYTVARIEQFVDSADMIVRAIAEAPGDGAVADRTVRFTIVERLRGNGEDDTIRISGRLSDRDDFNTLSVPYTLVRGSGQGGDCHAREYRPGAEYLLILQRSGDELTPYWKALAPLNEQIRGAADPWVVWVRERVGAFP